MFSRRCFSTYYCIKALAFLQVFFQIEKEDSLLLRHMRPDRVFMFRVLRLFGFSCHCFFIGCRFHLLFSPWCGPHLVQESMLSSRFRLYCFGLMSMVEVPGTAPRSHCWSKLFTPIAKTPLISEGLCCSEEETDKLC